MLYNYFYYKDMNYLVKKTRRSIEDDIKTNFYKIYELCDFNKIIYLNDIRVSDKELLSQ